MLCVINAGYIISFIFNGLQNMLRIKIKLIYLIQ